MKTHRYSLVWIRLVVSFLAAFHININGHWDLIPKAIVNPLFYVAFILSVGISYLILYIIHTNNDKLNRTHPWRKNRIKRIFLQILHGVVVPALADLVLISIFFIVSGRISWIPLFVFHDMGTVLIFIAFVNVIYQVPISLFVTIPAAKQVAEILEIKHNGVDVVLNVSTDILYIYKDQKNVKIKIISGHEYSKKDSISNIVQTYANTSLCQVNQSAIVNLEMIKGVNTGTRSKTLDLLFKPQFIELISSSELDKLYVTRKFMQDFKDQRKKYMAG